MKMHLWSAAAWSALSFGCAVLPFPLLVGSACLLSLLSPWGVPVCFHQNYNLNWNYNRIFNLPLLGALLLLVVTPSVLLFLFF